MSDDNLKRLAETAAELKRRWKEAEGKIRAAEMAAMEAAEAFEELEDRIYEIEEAIEVLQEAA